jgi:hypothetical protein
MDRRSFIMRSAAMAAVPVLPHSSSGAEIPLSSERRIPNHRFLFLDDMHIDRIVGLEMHGHPARRYEGNPLFVKKFPWENARVQLYGHCIIHNSERNLYQMFYMAMPDSKYFPNIRVGGKVKVAAATLPAYAESSDGIHWDRPLRKDVPFNTITETNLLNIHSGQSFEPGILWDLNDPDPDRQYKAFIWDQNFNGPVPGNVDFRLDPPSSKFPDGVITMFIRDESGKIIYEAPYNDYGIRVAFSPDGIRWKKHPGWIYPCYSDTGQSVLYDSRCQKYVAYGRFNQVRTLAQLYHKGADSPEDDKSGMPRRKSISPFNLEYIGRNVARMESSDFIHWSDPELVLSGDSQDPESFQINSMPVDSYEGLYIGIMEVDVRPFPDPLRPMQLAVSRDGLSWSRIANRIPLMEMSAQGAWDSDKGDNPHGYIRPAGGLFIHEDQVWMYYGNISGTVPLIGVGMAYWRRDGFVSLHAGNEEGELLTRSFIPAGPELHLNIDASNGEASVRVCDFQGRPLKGWKIDQPSETIHGDNVDTIVRWADSDFGKRTGQATTLLIRMRNADLYSFWTV